MEHLTTDLPGFPWKTLAVLIIGLGLVIWLIRLRLQARRASAESDPKADDGGAFAVGVATGVVIGNSMNHNASNQIHH